MDWKGHPLITAVIMKRECKEQEEELDQNHGESLFSSPWFWRRRKRKRKKNTPVERRRARKEPWLERKGFLLGVGTYLERAKCAFQTRPLRYVLCMCSVPYICVRESSEKWWRSRGGEGGGNSGKREGRKEEKKEIEKKGQATVPSGSASYRGSLFPPPPCIFVAVVALSLPCSGWWFDLTPVH